MNFFFRKFIPAFSAILVLTFVPLAATYAQLGNAMTNLDAAVGSKSKTGLSNDIAGTIGTVVRGVLAVTGTIFFLLTVYAGILWMTAQGSEEKVEKSKDIIKTCVIGLIITLSAYSITYFVTNRLSRASASVPTTTGTSGS